MGSRRSIFYCFNEYNPVRVSTHPSCAVAIVVDGEVNMRGASVSVMRLLDRPTKFFSWAISCSLARTVANGLCETQAGASCLSRGRFCSCLFCFVLFCCFTILGRHPICMCIAVLVLMPEGVVAYRNHLLLDSFGPIMQHGTKHKNRTIHMALQVRCSRLGVGLGS